MISQLNKYNKELKNIHVELDTLPLGILVKNGEFYTHKTDEKGIGITNNPQLIQQLARKKYLLIREKQLLANIKILTNFTSKHNNTSPQELISTFTKTYQSLPTSYFHHPSVTEWSKASYNKNTLYSENLIYQST
ncbi:MAG: hypothetical protein FWE07_05190, partial [Turicibacter sp.]|nr:hypothetical protein [Turicibacter sp.]